jgi:hypothetical protein
MRVAKQGKGPKAAKQEKVEEGIQPSEVQAEAEAEALVALAAQTPSARMTPIVMMLRRTMASSVVRWVHAWRAIRRPMSCQSFRLIWKREAHPRPY